jgi:hypothetical protein
MLKYDTCENGIYHAFALIVTVDESSDYSTVPTLQYKWQPAPSKVSEAVENGNPVTPDAAQKSAEAIKLWQYTGQGGPHTFWRFKMEVEMTEEQQLVSYSVDGQPHADSEAVVVKEGKGYSFFVPSKTQNFRWAGHSCNGFSAGLNPDEWNGPDPLWNDLLNQHTQSPFHAVVGGGDQSEYCSYAQDI